MSAGTEHSARPVPEWCRLFSGRSLGRTFDAACGSGEFAEDLLVEIGGMTELVGIDADAEAVREAREHFRAYAPAELRFRFETADLERIPEALAELVHPASYDTVCLGIALHHFEHPENVLALLWDLVAPGGFLVVSEMTGDGLDEAQTTARDMHHLKADTDRLRGVRHGRTWPRARIIDTVRSACPNAVRFSTAAAGAEDPIVREERAIESRIDFLRGCVGACRRFPGFRELELELDRLSARIRITGYREPPRIVCLAEKPRQSIRPAGGSVSAAAPGVGRGLSADFPGAAGAFPNVPRSLGSGFWSGLPRGFTVLAPMEDITDTVFRGIVLRLGRPDVFFTEFMSARALAADEPEALRRAMFSAGQRPIVAQIWGTDPDSFFRAARRLAELGFDGIDINMGCPQTKLTKKGACAALIGSPALAGELILAAREGASRLGTPLPVSVKTRIGFAEEETEVWCGFLLAFHLSALTVHGRTAAQMMRGTADWTRIEQVVDLRDTVSPETRIVGNGDIGDRAQLAAYCGRYRVDGLMAGRGAFRDPFLFVRSEADPDAPSSIHELGAPDRILLAIDHLRSHRDTYADRRNYEVLKKFFKVYLDDFPGAEPLRASVMQTHGYDESLDILERARAARLS